MVPRAVRVLGPVEQPSKGMLRTGHSCLPWHPMWTLCSLHALMAWGGLGEVVLIRVSYEGGPSSEGQCPYQNASAISSLSAMLAIYRLGKHILPGSISCRPPSLPSPIPTLWETEACGSSCLTQHFDEDRNTDIFLPVTQCIVTDHDEPHWKKHVAWNQAHWHSEQDFWPTELPSQACSVSLKYIWRSY